MNSTTVINIYIEKLTLIPLEILSTYMNIPYLSGILIFNFST